MSQMPRLIRIHILTAILALGTSFFASAGAMNGFGLNVSDCIQILSDSPTIPVFLNKEAFKITPSRPDIAWLVVDKASLSSILDHELKAKASKDAILNISSDYPAEIASETFAILVFIGIAFICCAFFSFWIINKFFGYNYAGYIFNLALDSFGDPTKPLREEIKHLNDKLRTHRAKIKEQEATIRLYEHENGPIKTVIKIMTREERQALKNLNINPEEFFANREKEHSLAKPNNTKVEF